jgi:hypothetical protein
VREGCGVHLAGLQVLLGAKEVLVALEGLLVVLERHLGTPHVLVHGAHVHLTCHTTYDTTQHTAQCGPSARAPPTTSFMRMKGARVRACVAVSGVGTRVLGESGWWGPQTSDAR